MSEMESQISDSEPGRCHECAKLFPTEGELTQHVADEHPDESLGNVLT